MRKYIVLLFSGIRLPVTSHSYMFAKYAAIREHGVSIADIAQVI